METLPKWIFKNMRLPHSAPIVNVVAMGVTLLSLIPVYLAQRLTTGTGGTLLGGLAKGPSEPREAPVRHNGPMIEFTDWAREILEKSDQAARRFNPDARIRLARVGGAVQAILTDQPGRDDERVEIGTAAIFLEPGLEGLVDVEEPHDRLVLRPVGSPPNPRGH